MYRMRRFEVGNVRRMEGQVSNEQLRFYDRGLREPLLEDQQEWNISPSQKSLPLFRQVSMRKLQVRLQTLGRLSKT